MFCILIKQSWAIRIGIRSLYWLIYSLENSLWCWLLYLLSCIICPFQPWSWNIFDWKFRLLRFLNFFLLFFKKFKLSCASLLTLYFFRIILTSICSWSIIFTSRLFDTQSFIFRIIWISISWKFLLWSLSNLRLRLRFSDYATFLRCWWNIVIYPSYKLACGSKKDIAYETHWFLCCYCIVLWLGDTWIIGWLPDRTLFGEVHILIEHISI